MTAEKARLLDLFVTWLVIIDSRIQRGLVAAAWQLADAASLAGIDALSDCHVRPHELLKPRTDGPSGQA